MNEFNRCIFCDSDVSAHIDERDVVSYKCPICDKVKITQEAWMNFKTSYSGKGHLFSGYLREKQFYIGKTPLIKSADLDKIIDSPEMPSEVLERADKFLLWAGYKSEYPGHGLEVTLDNDYPICYCKNAGELRKIIEFLISSGFIEKEADRWYVSLTNSGWNKFSELKRFLPENKNCFVAMWFDESMEGIYKNAIKRAIKDSGYKPVRIDKVEHNEKICDRIIREINVCKFMVSDFSGHRGGVYFEAGYAMGLGRPVIWLCRESDIEETHFDTRQYNHIVYTSEKDLHKKLYDRILATILR